MMHTLIIATAPAVIATLFAYLESRGHVLDMTSRAGSALALADRHPYDAVIVESTMPGAAALCRRLKEVWNCKMPVVVLGGSGSEQEMLAAFDSGADDYLASSCKPAEVAARLAAHSRRAKGAVCTPLPLQVGELVFDMKTYVARRAGRTLALTPIGYQLLACLMRGAPGVVSRAELIRDVWGDQPPDTDALRVHMHVLRLAVDKPFPVAMIRNLHGIGYQLLGEAAGGRAPG